MSLGDIVGNGANSRVAGGLAMKTLLPLAALTLVMGASCSSDHQADVEKQVLPLLEADAIVGCVVGVIDGGKKEVYGFGEVTRGDGRMPDGSTIYEIGSMTKAFTGMLLADLVERGEVELEAPLQDLLPEGVTAPVAKEEPITLLHLATHTSGLPRMPDNFEPADAANPYADYDTKRMFDFLSGHKLRRAPGKYEYSNYGMGLLGAVLAARAGKSYEELLTERILRPLGLDDTRMTLTEDDRDRLAPPYNAELRPDRNWDLGALAGAGGLRSTVDDCLKLLDAALATDAGEPSAAAKAIQASWVRRHGKPGEISIGLGWHQARDGVTWFHDGMTGGYSSCMYAYPPKRMGIVVLTNSAVGHTAALAEKILQSMLGMDVDPIAPRKAVPVDREVLEKYVGKYSILPWFGITVTLEDDKLMAQATWQEKFQLFPESPTKFFYKVVDAQITFVEEDDGTVKRLMLRQNGRDLPAVKVD
jgi:CubicO group peptidase (beta-lactamase class C family)